MIFISYRRNDEPGYVGRLADGLRERFGDDKVFMDIDDIAMGHNWRDQIESSIKSSSVVLLVIGKRWESELLRRRESSARESDVHLFELLTAQALDKPIVPVLLPNAKLPQNNQLGELGWLSSLHVFNIRDGQNQWIQDIEKLTEGIQQLSPLRESRKHVVKRNHFVTAGVAIGVATVLLVSLTGYQWFSSKNNARPVQNSFASDFAMPLGQIAHDWSDAGGIAIVLDAPVESKPYHYLNNLKFPAARGSQAKLMDEFCQVNKHCIDCTASPTDKSIQDAELITIRFTAVRPPAEELMKTADQKNVWSLQDNYLPWENIDGISGKRTLYTCAGDQTQ